MSYIQHMTRVGEGQYGTVFRCELAPLLITPTQFATSNLHVAVKSMFITDGDRDEWTVRREVVLLLALNGFAPVCPSFVPMFAYFERAIVSGSSVHVIEELGKCTVRELLRQTNPAPPPGVLMSVIGQLFMAIVFLISKLDMCHNDLYERNILYLPLRDARNIFKYAVDEGCDVYVRTCGAYVMVCDYGHASTSHPVAKQTHDFAHTRFRDNCEFDHLDPLCYHVLRCGNVPPYVRDILTVFICITRCISQNGVLKKMREVRCILSWLDEGYQELAKECTTEDSRFHVRENVCDFILGRMHRFVLRRHELKDYYGVPKCAADVSDTFDMRSCSAERVRSVFDEALETYQRRDKPYVFANFGDPNLSES